MDKLKKYSYLALILVLLIPVAQRLFKLTAEIPLNLETKTDYYPDFHFSTWFKGEYQAQSEEFINKNFGLRGHLVRFLNQMDFDLFSKSNGYQVVVGKDKHLFFNYNIESYLGMNHMNRDSMEQVMQKTAVVIDSLKNRNIEFLFVIVPSNAFYYSDKLPAAYDRITPRENQYTWYSRKATAMKMNFIDFNKWFLEMKDTVSYPLFPKYGTHYTYYSARMVSDSMVR
ncbi:MAG: hypothetical protein KA793_05155 [Bacteroidales bacterium]|nr:hypothetical protein [Bacteroidales bacterium]